MEVRLACDGDLSQMLTLANMVADQHGTARPDLLIQHPYHITADKLERDLTSERHLLFVAAQDDTIVGMLLCTVQIIQGDLKYRDAKVLRVEDTCVLPEYRSKGVASQLLRAAKTAAVSRGCIRLEANVWSFNEASFRFFQANGFEIQKMTMECGLIE